MSESSALVEHFFRHEYGRLVGLLTRRFGVQNLELIEDAVQMAMWRALQDWSRRGVPEAPAAWLYRTARNQAIDALRRETVLQRAKLTLAETLVETQTIKHNDEELLDDDSLQLLFLCCHPGIPTESQVSLALKIVGGFSIHEIARGLLVTTSNIEKRITRAKIKLREVGEELAELSSSAMQDRLEAVLLVLYLMFNEGFSASHGDSVMKRDVCAEALRLTRMLKAHATLGLEPTVPALLALMLMHSARFCTRIDADQCVVLLADQDRSAWDWSLVREGMHWMLTAARGEKLCRYHIEAAIAWEHCRASSMETTDWPRVCQLYEHLLRVSPSPMVRLNAIIAQSYRDNVEHAIEQLLKISETDRQQLRPWWDCAMAHLFQRSDQPQRARAHWRDALALATSSASRRLIEKRLALLPVLPPGTAM